MLRVVVGFILFTALAWTALSGAAHAAPPKGVGPEAAQATRPANETDSQRMELVRQTLARDFGSHLTLAPNFQPMFGDFDGDGVEDLAMVVTGNPAVDQGAHDYKLIDPYDSFFGYGDPKVLMSFPTQTPDQIRYVAIVHQWRSAQPKMKFVIMNLPFEQIEIGTVRGKKKKVSSALFATDSTGLHAQVFWDGRKYRWLPAGTD
jgi:hypothetical protein